MLMMEVESDPLTLEDPLDCSNDSHKTSENIQDWVIKLEPEIISDIQSEEIKETDSENNVVESRLRTRKPTKINFSDFEDESDLDWRPKTSSKKRSGVRGKKRRRRKGSDSGSDTDSDEENTIPHADKKRRRKEKLKRENYLKNYKQLKEKRSYVCNVCKKTFITASHLKEHIQSHCQCFPCSECGKVFNHLRSLQRHIAAGHDPNGDEKEDEAEEEAEDEDDGKEEENSSNYLRTETPGEKNDRCKKYYEQLKTERKYQCDVCQKTFITSGHLSTHMYCHSGKKWTCDGCGKNFSCERSLIRHKDTFPGEHWFPCQLCDMTFFRVLNIAKHMEIKHPEASVDAKRACELNFTVGSKKPEISGMGEEISENKAEKIYVCPKCLKIFYSYEGLRVHKQAMHLTKKDSKIKLENEEKEEDEEDSRVSAVYNYTPKYKCDVCFKQFVSLEGFEYHQAHQHVEKETKQKKKRKNGFDDLNDENEEVQEVPTASFQCKICSASFTVKSALQTHLKTHNVTKNIEVKTGSHQCCICPRSFTSSDGLKYHLATHTGERRYSCGQCGKRFIKKTHLSEHIATHSEVKYFKCLRCPRTFSTHSAYRKHIKHFPGPHSFPCNKCGKLFTKESMIEKHMCVDLVKITMAPEIKALLSEDMIEEYLCLAEEQEAEELARKSEEDTEKIVKTEDNTSHSCYKCFKVFPNLSSLQAHQNDHIGKQNYQCRFCPDSFKRADAFGAHIRNHLGSTPYMCLKCNRKFISPFTLSMHAKNYPGDHSFTCTKCQRWFPSEKRLEKHDCILQSSDVFTCACSKAFASWNELLQHAGTKPYKCCSCELKYPTLMALARHIKKHTGVKPFSCEICGKSFRAKNNYLNHKNVHRETKEIQCEHCEYKSKSQKRMDFHLFRKHDIGSNSAKSTLCPVCGVIFPYMSHMKKHVELEHGNDMLMDEADDEKKSLPAELCTLCGKMLNNKYTLANHMKKVHDPNGPKKDRELKCEVCGEKFRTTKRLQRHSEVHEAPGLRSCEICQKEFYFAKELRKHMRKHDTNKPFSCPRCGKHFKVSVSLKYHSTICGKMNQRSGGRKRKEVVAEEKPTPDVLYGHIEPLDLNNRPYTLQLYRR